MTVIARLSCGLVLTVVALGLSHVGAASALSCAPGTITPEQVVAGQAALPDGSSFFDHYDVAIVGTVLDVETETEPGDRHGRTTVTFNVHATFGEPPAAEVLRVSQGDPGWMTVRVPERPGILRPGPGHRTAGPVELLLRVRSDLSFGGLD
jgi:hypothetical protein